MALLQKHYLSQTLGAMGQGNGKIIAGLEGHFPDNAISSVPLSFAKQAWKSNEDSSCGKYFGFAQA